jgi:hypothetical protein
VKPAFVANPVPVAKLFKVKFKNRHDVKYLTSCLLGLAIEEAVPHLYDLNTQLIFPLLHLQSRSLLRRFRMANLTPEQQELSEKIIRLAKSDPNFGHKLETNEAQALTEAGLMDDYAVAFSDDVSGYRQIAGGDSICCETSICCGSSACCDTV